MERYITAHKKGKEVIVDTLWLPYMMERILRETNISEKWITTNQIINVCLKKEGEEDKIIKRLMRLNKNGFLKSRKMSLSEKRRLYGLKTGNKPRIYILGKRGREILKQYGNFTDPNCPLMQPKIGRGR